MNYLLISGVLLLFSLIHLAFFTKLIVTRINLSRENPHKKLTSGWAFFSLITSFIFMGLGIALLIIFPHIVV